MSMRALGVSMVLLPMLAVGCQRSSVPVASAPTPPTAPPPVAAPPPAALSPSAPEDSEQTAARIAEYARTHPWGEDTGTSRLSGTVTWAEEKLPPAGVPRTALTLKGISGTETEGVFYRVRADAQGAYEFDRIKPGAFMLKDASGRWRLRVEIADGQAKMLDLTPDNSVKVRDDFREAS